MSPKKPTRRPGRPAHPEPLAAVIHVKVTAREHAEVKAAAEAVGQTISVYVKRALFDSTCNP